MPGVGPLAVQRVVAYRCKDQRYKKRPCTRQVCSRDSKQLDVDAVSTLPCVCLQWMSQRDDMSVVWFSSQHGSDEPHAGKALATEFKS